MERIYGLIPYNIGRVTILHVTFVQGFTCRVLTCMILSMKTEQHPLSPNVINFMDDTNLRPGDECEEPLPCTWHTRIENIVYHSRDWASPGTVPEFRILNSVSGRLTHAA